MSIRSISRMACITFLVVGFIVAVAMLFLAIAMEGMRHSRPGPGQFDSYYWSSAIPVVLWAYWLTLVFVRLQKVTFLVASLVAGLLSFAWIVMLFEEGGDTAAVATALVAASFFASRWAQLSPSSSNEAKTA